MTDTNQAMESEACVKPDDGKAEKSETDSEATRINEEAKSVIVFAASSVVAGYLSFISGNSLPIAAGIMLAILFAASAAVQKLVGKKDMQWILGNGGAIYIFLWFVNWIIFYNL